MVVARLGDGCAVTIVGEALLHLKRRRVDADNSYFIIYIKQGIYEEHLVDAPNVLLIGDGRKKTIITGRGRICIGRPLSRTRIGVCIIQLST